MKDIGEKSLDALLSSLTATLHPTTYVFTTHISPSTVPPFSECQMLFRESDTEGVTAIVSREYAESRSLEYLFPCRMITLNVTSSLEAVGFMAVVATRLAEECGMGVNPVSGFYHDHLFVPEGREGEALRALERLARERGRGEKDKA